LTKDENSKEKQYPSERWARAKHFGGLFASKLNAHIVETLKSAGYKAVAPYARFGNPQMCGRYYLASNWSERHAAYVSGLGTFGLCDGLITKRGKAMHCYSVIAKIQIPPTPRPYKSHHDYCLYYVNGSCGACIKRCPAKAISTKGHDKSRCYQYCFGPAMQHVRSTFGLDDYACGLCQTGVPCESKNPVDATR
jgi:epoxyqueuosine reductase QueG